MLLLWYGLGWQTLLRRICFLLTGVFTWLFVSLYIKSVPEVHIKIDEIKFGNDTVSFVSTVFWVNTFILEHKLIKIVLLWWENVCELCCLVGLKSHTFVVTYKNQWTLVFWIGEYADWATMYLQKYFPPSCHIEVYIFELSSSDIVRVRLRFIRSENYVKIYRSTFVCRPSHFVVAVMLNSVLKSFTEFRKVCFL